MNRPERTRSERYADLAVAIENMSEIPSGLPFALEPEEGRRALAFVRLLDAAGAPPPRIFPNGEDQLVFKWAGPDPLFAVIEDDTAVFGNESEIPGSFLSRPGVPLSDPDAVARRVADTKSDDVGSPGG